MRLGGFVVINQNLSALTSCKAAPFGADQGGLEKCQRKFGARFGLASLSWSQVAMRQNSIPAAVNMSLWGRPPRKAVIHLVANTDRFSAFYRGGLDLSRKEMIAKC
jgi:hypothetical protein